MELVHQKGTGTRATTTTNRGGSILEWTRVCPNFLSTPCSSRHSKLFKQSDSISTCKWHVDPLTLRTLSQVQICQEILHTLCLNCTSSWASLPRKEVGSGRKRSINHSEEALTCFFFALMQGWHLVQLLWLKLFLRVGGKVFPLRIVLGCICQ